MITLKLYSDIEADDIIPEQPSDKRRKLKQAKAATVASIPVSIGTGMGAAKLKYYLAKKKIDKKIEGRVEKLAKAAQKEIKVARDGMKKGIKNGVKDKTWQTNNFNATKKNIYEALGKAAEKFTNQKELQLKRAKAQASNFGLKVGAASLLAGLGTAAYLAKRKVDHKSINDDNI